MRMFAQRQRNITQKKATRYPGILRSLTGEHYSFTFGFQN